MNRTLIAFALGAAFALGTAACASEFTVDGYGATYVNRPAYEGHRRYTINGTTVYEVDGQYYREHQGRWVVYRERPRELVEVSIH